MSTLTDIEKRYLEKLLGMQSGYVLNYSDATYSEFFPHISVTPKYRDGSLKSFYEWSSAQSIVVL